MPKFITLKMVLDNTRGRQPREEDITDGEDVGEDDGLPALSAPQSASAQGARPDATAQFWRPITISVDSLRNFYPRAGGREGTRIILKSGTAYAVLNLHGEVTSALERDGTIVDLTE